MEENKPKILDQILAYVRGHKRKIAGVLLSVAGLVIGARLVISDNCEECSEDVETPEE